MDRIAKIGTRETGVVVAPDTGDQPEAEVSCKVTNEFAPDHEAVIIWNHPQIVIARPAITSALSERARAWPPLAAAAGHFLYED